MFAQPVFANQALPVTVFAAASLTDVLQKVGDAYKRDTGSAVVFSFAASSALARQIEASSNAADIFMSADLDWMDYLAKKDLIAPKTRRNFLGNRLVLIAPATSTARVRLKAPVDLTQLLGRGRLALANPESVPAGKYAMAALTKLGGWKDVSSKVAGAENVRVALSYVARAEAPLGIVYETDAKAETKVRIVAVFPAGSHPDIVYPAALLKGAKPNARRFLGYLRSKKAAAIFTAAGFTILK